MALPDRFGPYRLLRKLGAGATAAVFVAEHQELGATRAHLSLAHDAGAAIAQVVLEGEPVEEST